MCGSCLREQTLHDKTENDVHHKADNGHAGAVWELGLDVVDDVAAGGGAGHDGGVGDGGCVVAEDGAAEHSAGNLKQRNT